MQVMIFTPLLYLFIGIVAGRLPFEIKTWASATLTRFVIPFVIIFNIATHRPGMFIVVVGIITIMMIMLLISRIQTRDPVKNLCFCYLNIGWLGLPIASALFGDGAARIFIAAYVGSSLLGNIAGVGLMAHELDLKSRVRKTIQSPPVCALLAGILMVPFGTKFVTYGEPLYDFFKFLMSFFGMTILGIWLSEAKLCLRDLRLALIPSALRAGTYFLLLTIFIEACKFLNIRLVLENLSAIYLLCLLPPAANIIVLETHYMQSGYSANMIACGTVVSIIAVAIYAIVIICIR